MLHPDHRIHQFASWAIDPRTTIAPNVLTPLEKLHLCEEYNTWKAGLAGPKSTLSFEAIHKHDWCIFFADKFARNGFVITFPIRVYADYAQHPGIVARNAEELTQAVERLIELSPVHNCSFKNELE